MFKSALDEGFRLMFGIMFYTCKLMWNIIVGYRNAKQAADDQWYDGEYEEE